MSMCSRYLPSSVTFPHRFYEFHCHTVARSSLLVSHSSLGFSYLFNSPICHSVDQIRTKETLASCLVMRPSVRLSASVHRGIGTCLTFSRLIMSVTDSSNMRSYLRSHSSPIIYELDFLFYLHFWILSFFFPFLSRSEELQLTLDGKKMDRLNAKLRHSEILSINF